MSSWFNIGGNLSTIASNVSNFTKEVLHDAANDTFEDAHSNNVDNESEQKPHIANDYEQSDELFRNISCLQSELHRMANDIAYKDEQLMALELRNEELVKEYDKHFSFLKEDLLEKEKELEMFAQKIHNNDMIYTEKEKKLADENTLLKNELAERKEMSNDSVNDDWGSEWDDDAHKMEMSDLVSANESLSNDLMMKEIVLNSIESKMFEISEQTIEAADFGGWIDKIINEKVAAEKKYSETIDILDKHLIQMNSNYEAKDVNQVNRWLTDQANTILELENETMTCKGIIATIEQSISVFDDNYSDFKIDNFKEWLDNLKNCLQNDKKDGDDNCKKILGNIQNEIREFNENYRNFEIENFKLWLGNVHSHVTDLEAGELMLQQIQSDIREFDKNEDFEIRDFKVWLEKIRCLVNDLEDGNKMLLQIQSDIREFDEEDENFEITNFQEWLEKVQCRIDDLEVEVINEQESREVEEQRRMKERDTLDELFKQKQNEISLLKVELYNKTSSSYASPVVEMKHDNLMTIQEEVNEITARCESLEIELSSASKQLVDTKEQLVICETRKNDVEKELNEFKVKYNSLEDKHKNEDDESHHKSDVFDLQNALNEASSRCDTLQAKFENQELISKDLETALNNMSADHNHIKEQLRTSESCKQSAEEELNELKDRFNCLHVQYEQLDLDHNEIMNKYEVSQTKETAFVSLQTQFDEQTEECNHIRDQLMTSEATKENLETVINELKCEVERANEQLNAANQLTERLKNELDDVRSAESESESKLEKKCENLCNEIVRLEKTISELSSNNNELHANIDTMHADIYNASILLADISDDRYQANQSEFSPSESFGNLFQVIREIGEKYFAIRNQVIQCTDTIKDYEKKLGERNEKLESDVKVADILLYIGRGLDNLFPEKYVKRIVSDDILISTEMSHYAGYLSSLEEFIQGNDAAQNDLPRRMADLQMELENAVKLFELERTAKESCLCKVDHLNGEIDEYKKIVEQLKSESSKSSGGGGMKFGALKRKLQELESLNFSLTEEIHELKKRNTNESEFLQTSIVSTDQLAKQISLPKYKTQQCEELQSLYLSLTNENKELKKTIATNKETLTENFDQISKQASLLNDQTQQCEELQSLNLSLTKENEELKKMIATNKETLTENSDQISKQASLLNDKTQQCEELQSLNLSLTKENEELKKMIAASNETSTENSDQISKQASLLNDKTQQCEELQSLNLSLTKENEELKKMIAASNETSTENSNQISKQASLLNDKTQQFEELQSLNLSLTKENEELKKMIATSNETSTENFDQISKQASLLNDKTQQCEELQSLNLSLTKENEELKKMIAANKETSTENFNQISKQASLLNDQTQQCEELQSLNLSLTKENEELKKMIATEDESLQSESRTTNEISNLKSLLNDKTQECECYAEECRLLKSSLLEMQEQIKIANSVYEECHQLKEKLIEYENALETHSSTSSQIDPDEVLHATQLHQEQLHNLSVMVTERNEEVERYRSEIEILKSKLMEVENETSDLELVREECKQLKAMLVGKEHQSGADETILSLQADSKQLKLLLHQKESDIQGLQSLLVEKENELSNMELIQEECKQLKQMLVNKEQDIQTIQTAQQHSSDGKSDGVKRNSAIAELQNSTSDMALLREECSQLKQMLLSNSHNASPSQSIDLNVSHQLMEAMMEEKEMEINKKDAIITDLRNKTSDLDLIQEECRQLKLMLLDRGRAFSPSESSAMSGIQDASGSSFVQQVQQLEEFLREKNECLKEKEAEIEMLSAVLTEKDNLISDFDLIQNESRILKQMLSDKEKVFMELQNDLDTANEMVQQKNHELKSNEKSYFELERKLNAAIATVDAKEIEIQNLNEELTETMAQDENLHILQTEYRNVEEHLKVTENELNIARKRLNAMEKELYAAENECERLKVYANQHEVLKNSLKEKEEELSNLKLQTSDNSILESETVTLLYKELNELKTLLYQSEGSIKELKDDLANKSRDLEKLDVTCINLQNHVDKLNSDLLAKEEAISHLNSSVECRDNDIESLKSKFNECVREKNEICVDLNKYKSEVDGLKNEKNTLLELCGEKDSDLKLMEDRAAKLEREVNDMIQKQKYNDEECVEEKNKKITDLTAQLEQYREEMKNLEISAKEDTEKRTELDEKLWELEACLENSREELRKNQALIDNHLREFDAKDHKISLLEGELVRCREYQERLVESINDKSDQNIACKNCEFFNNERKMINTILANILKILEIKIQNETAISIVEHLSTIEGSLQNFQTKIAKDGVENAKLIRDNGELKIKLDEVSSEKLQLVSDLERKLETTDLTWRESKASYEFKIKDMQSQLLENEELHELYQQKCSENDNLEEKLRSAQEKLVEIQSLHGQRCAENKDMEVQLLEMRNEAGKLQCLYETKCLECKDLENNLSDMQNKIVELQSMYETKCSECASLEEQLMQSHKKRNLEKTEQENKSKSSLNDECEHLRQDLERNSHLFLEKNKECDTLKLEMLQLEETVYELKLSLGQMRKFKEASEEGEKLKLELTQKNEEIDKLKSTLEDDQLKLQISKKEKVFLDELAKTKSRLEKEKEDLLFKNDQLSRLVQEKEVVLRHKDVSHRELEAKNNRELERLRNHMMMTEDMHTKDIIEAQEREDALQQELDEVKQGLSKKSIILQDSSKQFQEHVVDLEEQLHALSSQRDMGVLEIARCQEKMEHDGAAIYNLQIALEQLEKDKCEQAEYLTAHSKRKEKEYETRIEELTDELNKTQGAMSEAALAVQGINKLNLELQQKENELKVCKEKITELATSIQQRNMEFTKLMESADTKLDKSLLRNLFMKYFQAPNDKKGDILNVIGRLLGWSPEEMQQIGSGSTNSKVGGWISNVWGFSTPKKAPPKPTSPSYDSNKSFSELFIKFLESESTSHVPVTTTSLTLNNVTAPTIQMFSPSTTPDILAFHNNTPDQRIPAPGQEIPRVHTSQAQSTLKSILS